MLSWTQLILASACAPAILVACSSTPSASLPVVGAAPAAAEGTCAADQPATWPTCKGEAGTLRGRIAREVHNHPDVGAAGPDAAPAHQIYIDVGERQVIAVSASPAPECAAGVAVEGRLTWFDLGGPKGTPMSYANLVVREATIRCE